MLYVILCSLLMVSPLEARFGHFHPSYTVPYYKRAEWIDNNTIEKAIVFDISSPNSHEEALYLSQRLQELNHQINIVKEKLNFPGIVSLRYRQELEHNLQHLTKERTHIHKVLERSAYPRVIAPFPVVVPFIDPFSVHSMETFTYHQSYPRFRKKYR